VSAVPDPAGRRAGRVCLVAMPLMARSGVYRSTYDLVGQARAAGHDWTAVVGIRPGASGSAPADADGVREVAVTRHGRGVVDEVAEVLRSTPEVQRADHVVTLITQSDVAMARTRREVPGRWACWVRGLPWPDAGEQTFVRRQLLRRLETSALRKADDVWATTEVLAAQIASARRAAIVPAGVPAAPRTSHGESSDAPLVWAGRVDDDKRPGFFVEVVEALGARGRVVGEGPLVERLRATSPASVEWTGWRDPGELWSDASLYLGTSRREAFGRSAVEAAQAGLPMVLTDQYGAAPLLFTEPDLRKRFVVGVDDLPAWTTAVRALLDDAGLRREVSDHVWANAQQLTISASVDRVLDRLAGGSATSADPAAPAAGSPLVEGGAR
jgi:glycosyltransferase involved in cell wall biosynthesis